MSSNMVFLTWVCELDSPREREVGARHRTDGSLRSLLRPVAVSNLRLVVYHLKLHVEAY